MGPQTRRYSEESGDHTPAAATHSELRAVKTGQYTDKVAEADGQPHTVALSYSLSLTHVVFWPTLIGLFVDVNFCRLELKLFAMKPK